MKYSSLAQKVIIAIALLAPTFSFAATLSIAPGNGAVGVGDTITVGVYVSSDQSINAISGTLTFPSDLLSAESVSKAGSVLTLWVQDPSIAAGSVSWSAVVPNPGFTGRGQVLLVTFRAKQAGSAPLAISQAQVLANDGNGTNILSGSSGGTLSISEKEAPSIPVTPQGAYLVVQEVKRADQTDPRATFTFNAVNSPAKIDHYEVTIDQGISESVGKGSYYTYRAPALPPGDHILYVQSIDTVGNSLKNQKSFHISGLTAPVITDHSATLQNGETLSLKGTSEYPGASILLQFSSAVDGSINATTTADSNGDFSYASHDGLTTGTYTITATVVKKNGAESDPSAAVSVSVALSPFWRIVTYFLLALVALIAIIVLFFTGTFGWFSWRIFSKKLDAAAYHAEHGVYTSFEHFKNDVRRRRELLQSMASRGELSPKDREVIADLRKELEETERFIKEKLSDIGHELH